MSTPPPESVPITSEGFTQGDIVLNARTGEAYVVTYGNNDQPAQATPHPPENEKGEGTPV